MSAKKVVLIGNPNIGKSSLFNQLTGLRQKTGNYPGITVDKKTGIFKHNEVEYLLYDLPGTYSLYPTSHDEEIVYELLANNQHNDHPEKVIIVADATQLKRSLQLVEQVLELELPTILVINLIDEAEKNGISIDVKYIEKLYGIPVVVTNARQGKGIHELKNTIESATKINTSLFKIPGEFNEVINEVKTKLSIVSNYKAWYLLAKREHSFLNKKDLEILNECRGNYELIPRRLQVKEFLQRNERIKEIDKNAVVYSPKKLNNITTVIDKWVMHPLWGYVIFGIILFILFQSIFTVSQWPMEWIEMGFIHISDWVKTTLPVGPVQSLLADGVIPGISGILIFVPQITILFLGLLILEETGYMSRVVFLMDRWMKPFGLNGKSIVPLISGAACAIPAVMSARNIEHKKEKLITILVTPFITCSARLPVYALIIGLVIPTNQFFFMNLQGVVLMGMYLLGVLGALLSGIILKFIINDKYKSYLIMELPPYRMPLFKNMFISLWEKITAFVFGAGKIILAISIVLWVLSSFSPGVNRVPTFTKSQSGVEASAQLENSYLGLVGKRFEPAIQPLGYDWKTGIGILASFAAREVFVPTMATIYSIDNSDNYVLLKDKMKADLNTKTGKPVYSFASGISLLMFYAFAMMCMSTVAAVKRETKSWKWTLVQFVSMTLLAYIVSLFTYQLLS